MKHLLKPNKGVEVRPAEKTKVRLKAKGWWEPGSEILSTTFSHDGINTHPTTLYKSTVYSYPNLCISVLHIRLPWGYVICYCKLVGALGFFLGLLSSLKDYMRSGVKKGWGKVLEGTLRFPARMMQSNQENSSLPSRM